MKKTIALQAMPLNKGIAAHDIIIFSLKLLRNLIQFV